MYLLITSKKEKSGKIYRSAKIAEAYKTPEGKSRQKIIQNLGPVKSEEDEIKFRELIRKMRKGKNFIDVNSMKFISSKSYGIYYTVSQIFKKYELDPILKSKLQNGKHKFDIYAIIKALIINRLENPLSKNKAFGYIQKDYIEKIDCIKDNLYTAMDVLENKKEEIELEIFQNLKNKLKLNLDNVHYDITSSYFEGHKCQIATYGYSRDHRNDREQIVIGLILVDGIPIYHEVFEGNTSDKTTVLNIVKILKEKFGLKKPTIIGDRGMFTKDNIEKLESDKENYILGFSKSGNKITEEIIIKEIPIPKNKTQNAILGKEEIIELSKDNIQTRRYILCVDENTQKEQLKTLEEVKDYISKNLIDLKKKFEKSQTSQKGKKMTWESLIVQIKKVINRNKKLFFIIYDHENQKVDFKLNQEWYEREKKATGKFIIITNTDKTPEYVLKTYKELNTVESCFNCIKNQLDLRPVNHYKTQRVKAHVFICVLALLIEKIMARDLKEISVQSALDELKRLTVGNFKIGDVNKNNLSEVSIEQKEIFKRLKLIIPII
jgi:transposase